MSKKKILDFLYHDVRRVGSLLAQLSDAGLLTAVRKSEEQTSSGKASADGKLEGAVPFVAKASGGTSLSLERKRTGQLERTFDPLWQNARNFVEYAQSTHTEIDESRIGQIVSLTGSVTIIDFEFLKNFVANKSIMESLLGQNSEGEGNRQQRRAHGKHPKPSKSDDPPFAEIFGLFPYKIQMTVEGHVDAWSTLAEEFLVSEASDLVLKYGGALDGEWTVIGILDAVPSYFDGDIVGNMNFDEGVEAFGMKITKAMAPMARVLLGRPFRSYGITPLVVFRDIT